MIPSRIYRFARWALLAGGVLALLFALFTAWLYFAPGPMGFAGGQPVDLAAYAGRSPVGVPAGLASADVVTRGEYLTRAADCAACHTVKGGVPFAGGRAFKLPFGTIYTPNITPDRATGIGDYTDAQFLTAVHKGIRRDGARLYPAFPYASYTMMTDKDVLAIRAYLATLKPVHSAPPANTLVFPFNQRWLMAIWGTLFNPDRRFQPIPQRSEQWNRGAYLVEAAGHCGECHSPRNLMQAVDNRRKFAGGSAEGWTAYDISSDPRTGIGGWTPQELAQFLSTGHAAGRGTASGPMREAVEESLAHLTPGDIAAIVSYLRTVPPMPGPGLPAGTAGLASARPSAGPAGVLPGKRIFEGTCASCHAWTGRGALVEEAQLSGSRAVNDPSAVNVAQMIIAGSGARAPGRPYMPAFGASYTDAEIAAVANYVTARFGSKPSSIKAKDVSALRKMN